VFLRQFAANLEALIAHPSVPAAPTALPFTEVAASVVGSRLRGSRMLAATAVVFAAIGYAIGSRRARSSHHGA